MSSKDIRWGAAICGALLAEIAQIAAAFVWVAIYSYLINPGQAMAAYEQHAQASGPWVSIIAGFAIFYAASRWIARSIPTALALFAIFLAIDLTLFVFVSANLSAILIALAGASYLTKLLACYLGGLHGARPPSDAPA